MFTTRHWGQSIVVTTTGTWHAVAWINPRADTDKGIPNKRDRAMAKLIVDALNEYERNHFNEVVDRLQGAI